MFLNNKQVTKEIKREIKKFLERNDNENTTQNLWDIAKAVLNREVFRTTILPQEIRKTLNKQPNFTPKITGKRRKKENPKISRRRTEIIKI